MRNPTLPPASLLAQLPSLLCLLGLLTLLPAGQAGAQSAAAASGQAGAVAPLQATAAVVRPGLDPSAAMLAAARAGNRLVAVGERGVVLLSDGQGYRQAASVPISATLTGVAFADARVGWAVGHWGAILRTEDGGLNWKLQRSDLEQDQPLLAVHAIDAQRAVAVGLWSLLLTTQDGGRSWQTATVPSPVSGRKTDLNLYSVFSDAHGTLYATAEQGRVLRSSDAGQTWQWLDTGYRGSLWTGLVAPDGSLWVGGLRGTLMKSTDGGHTWARQSTPTQSSITGLAWAADGQLVASALDGVVLSSRAGGSFTLHKSPDRLAYTAAVTDAQGRVVLMSRAGPRHQLP